MASPPITMMPSQQANKSSPVANFSAAAAAAAAKYSLKVRCLLHSSGEALRAVSFCNRRVVVALVCLSVRLKSLMYTSDGGKIVF